MNYRHHFHAGNFADVMKHALLVAAMRGLQHKEKGLLLLDTHAGRGEYDLTSAEKGDSLVRQPEYPNGIGRLWGRHDLPPPLVDYLSVVRVFAASRGDEAAPFSPIRHYPGSPWLLRLLARPQDRMVFCEKQPDEFNALQYSAAAGGRAAVKEMDGYLALKALLPPPERRGLILIDPPFEARDEWETVMASLRQALRRFSTGTYAIWHPLTDRAQHERMEKDFCTGSVPPTWSGRLLVDRNARMGGCGLLVVNPPWKFAEQAQVILEFLGSALAVNSADAVDCRWWVPDA